MAPVGGESACRARDTGATLLADPLEKEANPFQCSCFKYPRTEGPGELLSMESQETDTIGGAKRTAQKLNAKCPTE